MANKNTIRVVEFEKLYYDNDQPFKKKHWEALCRYQQLQKKKTGIEYYRILHKGIQFTNYVGVIQAGSLTIEILPKIDKAITTAYNSTVDHLPGQESLKKQHWHNVLLQMLSECRLLRLNHVDYARLKLKANSILDIYIELFLAETEKLLHEGLIKKYRKEEGNKLALKGQLLFTKNISVNVVHHERFHVRHTEYNRTNIFNQLLYKTLKLIPCISNNLFLKDKINRLLLEFPEMPDCKVTREIFDKLIFDRKTERYKEALAISKMLLLNYRPGLTGGIENVIAILFDMNELWEEFIFRRLKKEAMKDPLLSISRQKTTSFWRQDFATRPKTIRPDIVIQKNIETIIVDTKWKIIKDFTPDDADLKQMFVYNLFWNCKKSFLIYPGNTDDQNKGTFYNYPIKKLELLSDNCCSVIICNILNDAGSIRTDLGGKLLAILFQVQK